MLMFLLSNWKVISAAALAFAMAYMLHSIDINRIEAKHKQALAAQVIFDITQCSNSKQPTKEGNENYQKLIADRDATIASLSKRPARCLYVNRAANDPKSGSIQPGEGNGLPSEVLYRFSGFCEADRAGLDTLQQYNEKVRCKVR